MVTAAEGLCCSGLHPPWLSEKHQITHLNSCPVIRLQRLVAFPLIIATASSH